MKLSLMRSMVSAGMSANAVFAAKRARSRVACGSRDGCELLMISRRSKRFQAKWIPVRVQKTRQNQNLERKFARRQSGAMVVDRGWPGEPYLFLLRMVDDVLQRLAEHAEPVGLTHDHRVQCYAA